MAETPGGKGKPSAGEIINLDLYAELFWTTDLMSGNKCVSDLCLSLKIWHALVRGVEKN